MYTVKPKMVRKFRVVCAECHSERVSDRATVVWDYDQQEWVAEGHPDGDCAWCDDCECETELIDQEILEPAPEWPPAEG